MAFQILCPWSTNLTCTFNAQWESVLVLGGNKNDHWSNYFTIWRNLVLSISQQKLHGFLFCKENSSVCLLILTSLLYFILSRFIRGHPNYHCAMITSKPSKIMLYLQAVSYRVYCMPVSVVWSECATLVHSWSDWLTTLQRKWLERMANLIQETVISNG